MQVRTLPLFDGFIETPFEIRFQGLLRRAWHMRSWHVIVAEPGSGKTMGIGDLRDEAARQAGMVGGRRYPVLAVTAPKNDPREVALGNLLLLALGVGSRGRWNERKYLLYDLLGQYGVECLICDDAHDLSMPHLIFLKDVFDQPETMLMQFRRRLDCLPPYCRVVSHTEGEVRDILLALEQIYRPSFPELKLQQWAGSIYKWLTHPLLDPQKSGRVLMDPLMKLVTTALKWSYAQREADVTSYHLKATAELRTLRRDNIQIIDAENNRLKEHGQEKQEPGEEQEKTKPKGRKAKEPKKQPSSDEPENPSPTLQPHLLRARGCH
jgi:AAA domain